MERCPTAGGIGGVAGVVGGTRGADPTGTGEDDAIDLSGGHPDGDHDLEGDLRAISRGDGSRGGDPHGAHGFAAG